MCSVDYWRLFMETGAPELYLMYSKAKQMEEIDVSVSTGAGSEGFTLQ